MVVTLAACSGIEPGVATDAGGGEGGSDAGPTGPVALPGLPCDVAAVFAGRCVSCHGSPTSGGAPYSILSRSDLAKPSPGYPTQSVAQRSLLRMEATVSPMPPLPHARATAPEIDAYRAWMNKGAPASDCQTVAVPDGGAPDAGPAPVICSSNSRWTQGTTGSPNMNPGLACRSCHLGNNFQGQNPLGAIRPSRAHYFMGTAYSTLHEADLCRAASPPSDAVVQILDNTGTVRLSLPVSPVSGNFYSGPGTMAGIALPYTARVVSGGNVREMKTPQTNGDCNTCHTEQGREGAPGRVMWP